MRLVCWIGALWLTLGAVAWAQETAKPTLEVQFEDTETVPGQPLTLRLTVLVPTFMPEPPEWPSFEGPNLLVRLPSKASSPTSKTVNGETWSGISRRYQITPLVPGRFVIPQSSVWVRYRAAQGDAVLEEVLPVPELTLSGVVPKGADGLDPFIAAKGLKLSQSVEGAPGELQTGDSFSRVVTAEIDGVTPMFLPTLLPETGLSRLRDYPETPNVDEKEERGVLSGVRSEKVVYVAEGAVDGALPEVTLRWYNLESKAIEVASVPAVEVLASAPVAAVGTDGRDYTRLFQILAVLISLCAVLALLWRLLARPVRLWLAVRRQAWLDSEDYAWRQLRATLRAQELMTCQSAFDNWRRRGFVETTDKVAQAESRVQAAFLALGRGRFGAVQTVDQTKDWQRLARELHGLRRALRYRQNHHASALMALNPNSLGRQ